MGYQSFPSEPGHSKSFEKLASLRLPSLVGKSFLDVGCNEGFFCGYAAFCGARRVVGIDVVKTSLLKARGRFPECEFLEQSWEQLPTGPFDVILLASALHYADSQPALVRNLVASLSPGGLLVLELGVAGGTEQEWVRVARGIDTRDFPTWRGVETMLRGTAWRRVGTSVRQSGDPVGRHVIHITPRRPHAYLLMAAPAGGKTNISRSLFQPAGLTVVSGDRVIGLIARGEIEAPAPLAAIVRDGFSPSTVDQVTRAVFAAGLGLDLVEAWLTQTDGQDFGLDAYVPAEHHQEVVSSLRARGYLVVTFGWERIGSPPASREKSEDLAVDYHSWLEQRGVEMKSRPAAPGGPFRTRTVGFVDKVMQAPGQLVIQGWAVNVEGSLPARLSVRLDGKELPIESLERRERPDVRKRLKLARSLVGYRIAVRMPPMAPPPRRLEVTDGSEAVGSARPFRLSTGAAKSLADLAASAKPA